MRGRGITSNGFSYTAAAPPPAPAFNRPPVSLQLPTFRGSRACAAETSRRIPNGFLPQQELTRPPPGPRPPRPPLRISATNLQSMRGRGITPNEFSYTAAANACAKTGDWERALGLLAEMKDRDGLKPNEFTFTAAVRTVRYKRHAIANICPNVNTNL